MIRTTDTITWEQMNELGITLRQLLSKSAYCKKAMERFNIKHISVIENIIKRLNTPAKELFQYTSCPSEIFVSHEGLSVSYDRWNRKKERACNIYVGEYQYASLTWNDIYVELFKKYYPTLYKAFMTQIPYEVNENTNLYDFVTDNMRDSMHMTIKDFIKMVRCKNKINYVSRFKIYAEGISNLFFLELPKEEGEHSIYLKYEDLLKIRQGKFTETWEDICNRCYNYHGDTQKESDWFMNSETTKTLKYILRDMALNGIK